MQPGNANGIEGDQITNTLNAVEAGFGRDARGMCAEELLDTVVELVDNRRMAEAAARAGRALAAAHEAFWAGWPVSDRAASHSSVGRGG